MATMIVVTRCSKPLCDAPTDAGAEACRDRQPILVLQASGALVTSITSSCANAHLVEDIEGTELFLDVLAEPIAEPKECHIEILLSDAEHFAFDIPFTKLIDCSTCTAGYIANWNAVFVSVPAPHFDGSFPSPDASDE